MTTISTQETASRQAAHPADVLSSAPAMPAAQRMRRRLLAAGLTASVLPATGGAQAAAGFPDRPLRLVVPYPAGGSTDIVSRLVAARLGAVLPGTVVVDNKGGAAGAIGSADVARSAADGYTLLTHIVTSAVIMPITQAKQLNYDPVADFQPVAMVCTLPNVLVVNKDIPVRSFAEFAAWARANAAGANYGTGGTGSVMHLTGEILKREAGFAMTHVPYKGAAAAIQDLMGGNLAAVLDNITGLMAAIRSGQVRALGVSTAERSPALPDVPTFAEAGVKGFANASWLGIFTRAGTPPDILVRLEKAVLEGCAHPDAIARMKELGATPSPMGARELQAFWTSEFAYWRKAIAEAGIPLK